MTTIAFFKTPELAQNKIQSLENSRLNGDNSTYSIAKINGVYVVQGVISSRVNQRPIVIGSPNSTIWFTKVSNYKTFYENIYESVRTYNLMYLYIYIYIYIFVFVCI
jgi:hypothetical protein